MAQLHDIILRPIVTEKTVTLESDRNTYVFEVGMSANKVQIANAVRQLFDVRVEHVRTIVVRGKARRLGRHMGQRSNWKKAYVKLAEGDRLDFLGT